MGLSALEEFAVSIDDRQIVDLRDRLVRTRWPDQLPDAAWDYGTNLEYLQELCDYWRTDFDFEAMQERSNEFPQFLTTIDGQRIHFIHVRSPQPDARPLLLTHGWPGSVLEFRRILGLLVDPAAHGGDPGDAFHVVAPSLPGFAYSGPTVERGWDAIRVARAFADLMSGLGYERFFAQGGDWGSMVTMTLAALIPERVPAIHVNLLVTGPPPGNDPTEGLTDRELEMLAAAQRFAANETGYQAIQSTKPQSLSYGLSDSPAGLAGWIVEKFRTWSDCDGQIEKSFSRDDLLDIISTYWFTNTINSSMRLYYETLGPDRFAGPPAFTVPVGHASFPKEILRSPRSWCEAEFNVVHWTDMPRGGHFAAMEEPELLAEDVRACLRTQTL